MVPRIPALAGPEARASEWTDHPSKQSGLWAGADSTLSSVLLLLIVVWSGILLLPFTQ
ncbi:hypothetical protein KTAU_12280 [Thermogemmatispora aurantia]|uniref:Uncharacterized protein n=1 Tax=Thermogemmatispora aurantia TaxID=2045279 RepID=A0A5J4K7C4_9CHLR|nr:hypothetical protein [Thermogemmatispora aurantia]GER82591.1 hypothetical protein KTAU_12280 [Thermogemmatispora aurantia]